MLDASRELRARFPDPLLEVRDLQVGFPEAESLGPVIDGLDLAVNIGEIVALVGESGSGKSMTALSLVRLLPAGAAITGGRVTFGGEDILRMSSSQLDQLRGGRIAMLFQQPQVMLDPTSRVGSQVAEPIRLHRNLGGKEVWSRVIELLREVGIPEPDLRARCFPHELSGGMAQRVMIAAALGGDPDLLIADEPTTALDVTIQAQILRLLDELRHKRRLAILLITHDLSIVSAFADRIAVMYAGRIVEEGPTNAILNGPQHPYSQALVRCSKLEMDEHGALYSIPSGRVQARDLAKGCRFHPRCRTTISCGIVEQCTEVEPPLVEVDGGRTVRCWAVRPNSNSLPC